tara:strand:+ start:85 stop:213 length:129 start_codon:yes stop_codon:yes gene_type:complete
MENAENPIKRSNHSHRFRDNLDEKNMNTTAILTGISPTHDGG